MAWWVWIVAGLALVVLELVVPGVFLLFFGAAAIVVGIVAAAGAGLPLWAELLAFSVLSIASLLLFRGPLMRRMQAGGSGAAAIDDLSGELGVAQGDIPPGERGRIELRGTVWTAVNDGDQPLTQGARCRVVRADGLTLRVVADR